jgi:iron complex outermembrane receptor protein
MTRSRIGNAAIALLGMSAWPFPAAHAQDATAAAEPQTLAPVEVTGTLTVPQQLQAPGPTSSITAAQSAEQVNAVNTEDMLKYLPDLLVRKRYIGDTNAPLATRTTGINASARSLIYVDGMLLSTLINNNNGNGSPQWFMVNPQDVDRIDVMYGPYSAAYPGNSYGAVTAITTRMPTAFEASVDVIGSTQHFSKYGTHDDFGANEESATLGDKTGRLSWSLSAKHLDSTSQPITFGTVTQSKAPATAGMPVVTGGIGTKNRTDGPIQVIGSGNTVHTVQDSGTLDLAYDLTPTLKATYALGYWHNDATAKSQSYLTSADGSPYYGGAGGMVNMGGYAYSASSIAGQFSSNSAQQEHLMQGLGLKSDTGGPFDWSFLASDFSYLEDKARLSTGLYPAARDGGPGRITDMEGTGWQTLDLNGTWRPPAALSAHNFSFGVHYDRYKLQSPTWNTADWQSGSNGSLYSKSSGNTATSALWVQDVWKWTPSLTATLGGRYEWWRAYDGYNFATAGANSIAVNQPVVRTNGISPKASLSWQATDDWSLTGSYGRALRFPTVGELYQTVQTGTTFVQANPFLKPEDVQSYELALERTADDSHLRVSIFQEDVRNALISQTSSVPGFATPVSFTQNVDRTRARGIELAGSHDNAFIRGLQLSGNVTYVDAHILQDSSYVPSAPGASADGKRTPYIPTWRATAVATYKPNDHWSYTVAGRYSTRMWATVDNTDVNPATYMGFQSFLVFDGRVKYDFDKRWSIAFGVDNIFNRNYFLYHPFPQRTLYAEVKYAM